MSAAASLDNLLSGLVQVSVIAILGALLPGLLQIRHPKSQLAYYHVILLLCFALPLIQPWRHLLVVASTSVVQSRTEAAGLSWSGLILAVAGLGMAVKLFWLGVGLWQLRRFRRSAIPIFPIPESIREARIYTGADAMFCISRDVAGPATMGFFDPVVLLPESFLLLNQNAQRSVACHELLHVWRNDWLVTVAEEVAASLLWFHPGVWWLIARAKLTREQVVDAEVVRMTEPAPYIEALLSMAVVSKARLAVPAAPFFTEGHLVQRMRALLASPRRSLTRLSFSYAGMARVLALAGWSVLILFPLNGEAQIVMPTAAMPVPPAEFNVQVTPPEGATQKVIYFANREGQGPTVVGGLVGPGTGLMPPPPPPPPSPGSPIQILGRGYRVLRPGQIATPAEIESLIAAFPERSLVQVIQAKDGTVQKVMVTRRPADETTSNPLGADTLHSIAGPTGPTGATDGVH